MKISKELNGLVIKNIECAINDKMENLEDLLNEVLAEIIDGLDLNLNTEQRLEALVLARTIFFKG